MLPPQSEQATGVSREMRSGSGWERKRRGDRRVSEGECPPGMEERRKTVRRRANRVQGRGLETLGHAVEYLMDSRIFVFDPKAAKSERDAVQILMRSSRAVFAECQEVVTLGDRLQRVFDWMTGHRPGTATEGRGMPQL